jgi:hypothetical protein
MQTRGTRLDMRGVPRPTRLPGGASTHLHLRRLHLSQACFKERKVAVACAGHRKYRVHLVCWRRALALCTRVKAEEQCVQYPAAALNKGRAASCVCGGNCDGRGLCRRGQTRRGLPLAPARFPLATSGHALLLLSEPCASRRVPSPAASGPQQQARRPRPATVWQATSARAPAARGWLRLRRLRLMHGCRTGRRPALRQAPALRSLQAGGATRRTSGLREAPARGRAAPPAAGPGRPASAPRWRPRRGACGRRRCGRVRAGALGCRPSAAQCSRSLCCGSVGSGGAACSAPSAAAAQAPGAAELAEARERGRGEYGCVHYRRRCRLVAPCCGEVFTCRHCHNEKRTASEWVRAAGCPCAPLVRSCGAAGRGTACCLGGLPGVQPPRGRRPLSCGCTS